MAFANLCYFYLERLILAFIFFLTIYQTTKVYKTYNGAWKEDYNGTEIIGIYIRNSSN